jgi:stage II sporulation protein D
LLILGAGCPGPTLPASVRPSPTSRSVRDIRVLLTVSQADARIRVLGPYTVRQRGGAVLSRGADLEWAIVAGESGVTLGGRPLGGDCVEIVPDPGGVVAVSRRVEAGWSPARHYAGLLRLQRQADGTVQLLNVVDVESYVAGVLPGELYPGFHPEAFKAQAIAARTYCLYEMSTNNRDDYDVTASESSQVYAGLADTAAYRRACAAVEQTGGMVCTWTSLRGERIFCTYFSSACGGQSQSVADAKGLREIPPLAGGVRCDYCRIAKGEAYRWAARSISAAELLTKLAARYPAVAEWRRIVDVRVARLTAGGRVGLVVVTGDTGATLQMLGENFRLAVGSRVMRSTDCKLRFERDTLFFEEGKGFGHGMGLCQWGMEGQARSGRTASQILRFYYPGSHITRAY